LHRSKSLRLEEHEDPEHPVVKLATQRIEELSGQAEAIAATIAELEAAQPEEIEALLGNVPDLREALAQADSEELIELLDAFDVAVNYYKPGHTLELSALLANDFVSDPETKRPPGGRSRNSSIAGAGFEPATFGVMSLSLEIGWTTWGTVSSGFREIELRGDRLESVGHVAPFVAPADRDCEHNSSRWSRIPGKTPILSSATSTLSWTRPRSRSTGAIPTQSRGPTPAAEPAVRRRRGPCCVAPASMEATPPSR
jgi:hypothetical protein